ncbi:hypothetical protein [Pseudomonas nitroreducens]|uniref:hypothetical protein n=1 Tax=Pseudomonas nitroreducens TaxID=46680 RepID=UPI00265AC2B8|nr:hypothetical protein [Pseudomonas nitroreducens]MCP1649416.1 hypothetical protein [Pseudomonas nitroreducens]MCP1684623.1 hypothetical protein [Pseudomonas nitroreducens]
MLSYLLMTAALALAVGLPFEFRQPLANTWAAHIALCLLLTVTLWVLPATAIAAFLYGLYWLALQGAAL